MQFEIDLGPCYFIRQILCLCLLLPTTGFAAAQPGPPSPGGLKERANVVVSEPELAFLAEKVATEEIPLLPGFNLISLPEEPAGADPAVIFVALGGQLERVETYDTCDTSDPEKVYDPTDPAASDLTVVDHRVGLWVAPTTATVLPSDGTLPASTSIDLCVGWNLIGFPAGEARHPLVALSSIAGKWDRLFGYDAFDSEDPWEIFDPVVPAWANDLRMMQPGRGYWLLVNEATTLTLTNQGPPPTVSITAPVDLAVVTEPTEIIGTVASDRLDSWTLSYRAIGEGEALTLTTGDTPVTDSSFGTFDPTLLLNGLYELELVATDLQGQQITESIAVVVDGRMKIGHFTVSFVDLTVPVAGVPIQIVRTYDSRARNLEGDFGFGWTLDVRQGSYRNNRPPGEGWQIQQGLLPCEVVGETRSHLTTIRLSDREIYRFRSRLTLPAVTAGGCFATAGFEFGDGPVPGATLEILGNTNVFYANGSIDVVDADTLQIYEPRDVRLTTRDGRVFDLDLTAGIERIADANGNTLTIDEGGITHSSGESVLFRRDAEGRIVEMTDSTGQVLSYAYDPQGDLISFEDRVHNVFGFRYETGHFLAGFVDPQGKEIATAQYASDGRVERLCDSLLRCTVVEHDLANREERQLDATDRQKTYRYDARGNVTVLIDGAGNATQFEYDDRDNLIRQTDAEGGVTTWRYDAKGDLEAIVRPYPEGADPADYTTTAVHDSSGRLTQVTRPDSSTWHLFYDDSGNLMRVEDAAGHVLESTTFDASGRVTSESDRFGTDSYQNLNRFGEPLAVLESDGSTTSLTYDGYGEVTSMTGPLGTWSFAYDAAGRETRSDYGGGFVHTAEYDALGREVATTNPLAGRVGRRLGERGELEAWELADGLEMTYQRDAAGRTIRQVDPVGRIVSFSYDAAGRISERTSADVGKRTYERDRVGRVTKVVDAQNHERSFGYFPDGRAASSRDPLGREWSFDYGSNWLESTDPLNRTTRLELGSESEVTRVVRADGSQEIVEYLPGTPQGERDGYPTRLSLPGSAERTYSYDSLGRLASATDLSGATWSYSVQTDGLKETLTTPDGDLLREDVLNIDLDVISRRFGDGGITSFTYGLSSDPIRITRPSGETISITYDSAGRIAGRVTSGGENEVFTWNAIGEPLGFSDATGASTWSYDSAGRPSQLAHSDGSSVAWAWDVLGRLASVTVTSRGGSSASTTSYRYDAVGDLVEVETPVLGISRFEYDAVHRLRRRTLPNGVVSEWTYDLRDRVSSVQHTDPGGAVLAAYVYSRGLLGEIERLEREDGSTVEWTYDGALRVTAERHVDASGTLASETTWTWDAAGNRTGETQSGVAASVSILPGQRLAQVAVGGTPTESYAWDADGRLASMAREGVTWTLGYDSKDALRSISDGTTSITYAHDAIGRRRSASDGSQTRHFVVGPVAPGGLDVVHHVSDGTSESQLVWAGARPLARIDADGTIRWYLEDGLGSVVGLADESGGLAATRQYDAFGNVTVATGEADPAHWGGDLAFQGQWREAATGLYHLRARDYDPRTGRFLSRDPAEGDPFEPESLHPYLFANGNPLLFQDPPGLFSVMEVNVGS